MPPDGGKQLILSSPRTPVGVAMARPHCRRCATGGKGRKRRVVATVGAYLPRTAQQLGDQPAQSLGASVLETGDLAHGRRVEEAAAQRLVGYVAGEEIDHPACLAGRLDRRLPVPPPQPGAAGPPKR